MAKKVNVDLDFQNEMRGVNVPDPSLRFDMVNRNYVDNYKYQVFHEHFFGNLPNSWGTANTGGGSSTTVNSISALDSFGLIRYSTGTTTTGKAAIQSGQNMTLIGGSSIHSFGGRFRVPTLSVATQRFTIRKGLTNAVTGAGDPTNGIYLRYSDNLNGGALQLVCRRASVEAVFNVVGALVANDWVNWRIEVNAALTQVDLYGSYNNAPMVFIGSVTTANSIPLNSTVLGFWSAITKSVGTTARTMDDDLLFYDLRFAV